MAFTKCEGLCCVDNNFRVSKPKIVVYSDYGHYCVSYDFGCVLADQKTVWRYREAIARIRFVNRHNELCALAPACCTGYEYKSTGTGAKFKNVFISGGRRDVNVSGVRGERAVDFPDRSYWSPEAVPRVIVVALFFREFQEISVGRGKQTTTCTLYRYTDVIIKNRSKITNRYCSPVFYWNKNDTTSQPIAWWRNNDRISIAHVPCVPRPRPPVRGETTRKLLVWAYLEMHIPSHLKM